MQHPLLLLTVAVSVVIATPISNVPIEARDVALVERQALCTTAQTLCCFVQQHNGHGDHGGWNAHNRWGNHGGGRDGNPDGNPEGNPDGNPDGNRDGGRNGWGNRDGWGGHDGDRNDRFAHNPWGPRNIYYARDISLQVSTCSPATDAATCTAGNNVTGQPAAGLHGEIFCCDTYDTTGTVPVGNGCHPQSHSRFLQ